MSRDWNVRVEHLQATREEVATWLAELESRRASDAARTPPGSWREDREYERMLRYRRLLAKLDSTLRVSRKCARAQLCGVSVGPASQPAAEVARLRPEPASGSSEESCRPRCGLDPSLL